MYRREFVRRLSVGAFGQDAAPSESHVVRLINNENPYGPGRHAMEALLMAAGMSNRYPGRLRDALVAAVARTHDVPREYVMVSGGSGDIMRAAVYAFADKTRSFVTARPSYEAPMRSAQHVGAPVLRVPLTPTLTIDLAAMGVRSVGAGFVYICSPNNPSGTAVTASDMATMIEGIVKASPQTRILVDEAYFDYADLPGFGSMIPMALAHPQVVVTRSFSKIHGMAGMRVGYGIAHPDTLAKIRARHSRSSTSSMSLAAAIAALEDVEYAQEMKALNRRVRASMVEAFTGAGYRVAPSDANFIFVNIRQDAKRFADACESRGVLVGRPFPPLNNWARISVGTEAEMRVAMPVFADVLAAPVARSLESFNLESQRS